MSGEFSFTTTTANSSGVKVTELRYDYPWGGTHYTHGRTPDELNMSFDFFQQYFWFDRFGNELADFQVLIGWKRRSIL